jgi:zona occludens toxin (predicted ATPase)
MRILVSAASMVRTVVVCFLLGIVIGVYFGVAGSPSAVTPADHSVDHSIDSVNPVNATAP